MNVLRWRPGNLDRSSGGYSVIYRLVCQRQKYGRDRSFRPPERSDWYGAGGTVKDYSTMQIFDPLRIAMMGGPIFSSSVSVPTQFASSFRRAAFLNKDLALLIRCCADPRLPTLARWSAFASR